MVLRPRQRHQAAKPVLMQGLSFVAEHEHSADKGTEAPTGSMSYAMTAATTTTTAAATAAAADDDDVDATIL